MDIVNSLISKSVLISRNAESDIYLSNYLGKEVIIKKRVPKCYRDKWLDKRIRINRTYREAHILYTAFKNGVNVPKLLYSNLKEAVLVIEYLRGSRLSDMLNHTIDKLEKYFKEVGVILGRLHSLGIVHGDPHPSNFISVGNKLYVIDFGLSIWSKSLKDQVYDIDVLYRSLNSLVPNKVDNLYKSVRMGYSKVNKQHDDIFNLHQSVLKMGRYHERR